PPGRGRFLAEAKLKQSPPTISRLSGCCATRGRRCRVQPLPPWRWPWNGRKDPRFSRVLCLPSRVAICEFFQEIVSNFAITGCDEAVPAAAPPWPPARLDNLVNSRLDIAWQGLASRWPHGHPSKS